MFFSRSISKQTRPTPESICEALSLHRIEYGQALLEWYQEVSKLSTVAAGLPTTPLNVSALSSSSEICRTPPGFPPRRVTSAWTSKEEPIEIKYGCYVHNEQGRLQLLKPTPKESVRHKIIDQKILNCLRDGPMDTLTIGRKILGRTTWRRPISTTLYRMASDGTIIHHQEEGLHIWELTSSQPVSPIIVPGVPSPASA